MKCGLGFIWNRFYINWGCNVARKKTVDEAFVECLEELEKKRNTKQIEKDIINIYEP